MYYKRTTKSGGLPNLSYIKRKPEPLGTKFKVANDGLSGMMAWIKIQEGKERMTRKDFFFIAQISQIMIHDSRNQQRLRIFPQMKCKALEPIDKKYLLNPCYSI